MQRTIAIYFNDPEQYGYPFDNAGYLQAYREFTPFAAARGIHVIIARGQSYLGNMCFARGWRFVGDELEEISQPVTVDLVYNKELYHDLKTNPGDLVVNDPVFDRIARDKWLTAQAFPNLIPPTYRITSENWREVFATISTKQVVLKPIASTEGRGIIVDEKSVINFPDFNLAEPYIAQAFIDSSNGIPGICTGMHDLRVTVFGGKPTVALLRVPKPGSVLSNVAQGGSARALDVADVPLQIMEYVRQIDDYYSQYPSRIYTADFFMENERAYLIETNTRPGFPRRAMLGSTYTDRYFSALCDLFSKAIKKYEFKEDPQ